MSEQAAKTNTKPIKIIQAGPAHTGAAEDVNMKLYYTLYFFPNDNQLYGMCLHAATFGVMSLHSSSMCHGRANRLTDEGVENSAANTVALLDVSAASILSPLYF